MDASAFPRVESFSAAPTGDGSPQHPQSLQVPLGTELVLRWKGSNAEAFELTDPAHSKPLRFPADKRSVSVKPKAELQDYTLVALSGGARSAPAVLHVSTHAEGDLVSTHSHVEGPPRTLKLVLQDDEGTPRKGLRFTLRAGEATVEGTTSETGELEATIDSDIGEGELVLHAANGDETYAIVLGGATPADAEGD